MKGTVYEQVGGLRPGRSAFDLSHSKMFDCDLGKLIPVLCEELLPGDVVDIGASQITKMQPMVVPLYHRMDIRYHVFFVPFRILWKDWQKFITGGVNGTASIPIPTLAVNNNFNEEVVLSRYGIWDYMGFRMDDPTNTLTLGAATAVMDFPWRAYWAIWRDYYRDENLQSTYPGTLIDVGQDETEQLEGLQDLMDEYVNIGQGLGNRMPADELAYAAFAKDYFTSSLPWQQRGTTPSVPISGPTSAVWADGDFTNLNGSITGYIHPYIHDAQADQDPTLDISSTGTSFGRENLRDFFNKNQVSFATSGIDISDLRYAIQLQRWMERNARAGFRYNEFLLAHFGVAPSDERLQRPEYVGGMKQPIVTSEVLQTSSTDTNSPQGTFAGHGMSVGSEFAGKYRAKEHGILMGIMSIMPEAVYQQGVNRKWTKTTRFDFYSPEFAHLSEQETKLSEIYWQNAPIDDQRFGFQGAYDEYRTNQSVVCGRLATDLKYWTLSRIFTQPPSLNAAFITTEALSKTRREAWAVSAVENQSQGEFLVRWNNHLKAIRPMPYIPDPGLMDHF